MKSDPVHHPAHYTRGGYETIEFIEQYFDDSYIGGQVIKYVSRAGHKDPALYRQDIEKALWYARRMAERPVARWHMQDIGREPDTFEADLDLFVSAKSLPPVIRRVISTAFYGYWDRTVEALVAHRDRAD